MNQKLLDYEKTLAVIWSCRTNAQNQVAYRMIWNFQKKHNADVYSTELFAECDKNLLYVMAEKK